jgi:glutamate synthase (NADPH/NADH) small chain
MGKLGGFLEFDKKEPNKRDIEKRLKDYLEIYEDFTLEQVIEQAARCMDCGVPFCHFNCPLGNVVPEFNDAVFRKQFKRAAAILTATNNFPEFTGRLCPALCEKGCVLNIGFSAVTISDIEKYIVEIAFEEGWIKPKPPEKRTGKKIAIVGSGPAGLAAADQLNKAGHRITVFEKNTHPGGIIRYGIPDFKIEKRIVERRIDLLKQEGIEFKTNTNIGEDITTKQLLKDFDAICLAIGAEEPRDLPIPGRELNGVYFAMDYLTQQNKLVNNEKINGEPIDAKDKNVLVIGGGDTGADCIGTANRQGAKSVTQVEIMPKPPAERTEDMPWPTFPNLLKESTSHEEGCDRYWNVMTKELVGDDKGNVKKAKLAKVEWFKNDAGKMQMKEIEGSEFEMDVDLVIIAIGFVNPVAKGLVTDLGVELDDSGNVKIDNQTRMTTVKSIFAAGDASRGASLIVHAIADGRRTAHEIDKFLMGKSELPEV